MNTVIGIDFGSDSVRAVLVNADNGQVLSSEVSVYKRWLEGQFCVPSKNQFRQHTLDHIEGMTEVVRGVIVKSKVDTASIKGICIDTTGSSPIPLSEEGVALCELPEHSQNPNAMMVLWKDHTSIQEAEEINSLSHDGNHQDFTRYVGGIYSSEWFWAKILHVIREDQIIRKNAFTWMEHCDYMTYLLVGRPVLQEFKRSRCAAGHKAMWHESWSGLPSKDFLSELDPYLGELRDRLYSRTYTSDQVAGTLSHDWAERLKLSENVVVTVGTFDAHAGAIGGEAQEGTLVRVMGTSTCDIMVTDSKILGNKCVRGICGQVDGSVVPKQIGLEAGQSAFGDALAWFKNLISWPLKQIKELSEEQIVSYEDQLIARLSEEAFLIPSEESIPVALDWINGRRTPDANQNLKSAISEISLGTDAPRLFKAMVEAICFGSKKIVDRFEDEGVEIKEIVGIGGVAKKSGFVMQTLSDVLGLPIKVAKSDQAPALGAAMYAAVAAGLYANVEGAISAMGNGFEKTYYPRAEKSEFYNKKYKDYGALAEFIESQTLQS